ncbi:hypothetical protein ACNOYE_23650 [Nannocystaceae bacterium ST9]
MSFEFDDARDLRWRARLHERLRRLSADPRFEVIAAHAGESLVAPAYPIYPSDIAVRWFEREGPNQGELHWLAIEPVGGDRVGSQWFDAGSPEQVLAADLSHFEDHPEGGEGVMVLARASGELFMHDSGRGVLLPLAIGFEDYVEIQIAVLGLGGLLPALAELSDLAVLAVHGWPETCESAREAARLRASQADDAAATLAQARRLFADQDLSILERRVDQLSRR